MSNKFKKDESKTEVVKEWAGNSFNGNPSFQGYAFGYGGKTQLAAPVSSQIPEDFEQILKDIVEDELLKGLYERHPADQFYNDLPGSPGGITNLAAKKQFVPVDPEEKNDEEPFGPTVGGFPVEINTPNNVQATTKSSQGKNIIDMNALAIDYLPEESVGIWSSFGRNQLAAPRDFQKELEDQKNGGGDITAKLPLGGMGNVSHPKTHVPNSVDNTALNLKSLEEKVINKNKGLFEMKLEAINSLINEIIYSEMASHFANFLSSEKTLNQMHMELSKILQKYNGDYAKAEASQEWQDNLKKYQATANKELEDKKMAAKVAGMFPEKEPLLEPFATNKKPTGPIGTTPTSGKPQTTADKFSQRLRAIGNKKMQFADTVPASDATAPRNSSQSMPPTRKSIPERKNMSMMEAKITQMVREAIVKELKETVSLYESMAAGEPSDGDVAFVDGETWHYDSKTAKWYVEREFDQLISQREEEWLRNNPESLETSPENEVLNQLLETEFENGSNNKSKISEAVLGFMIEKAVKKFLFEGSE